MSREPIGKGERITFILNPSNPEERFILECLKKKFNKSSEIKRILYNFYINNQLSNNDNMVAINYSMNDNSITNSLSKNDNKISNDCVKNDKPVKEEKEPEKSSSFDINLDDIEDKEINSNDPIGVKEVTKNAMDFMLNM